MNFWLRITSPLGRWLLPHDRAVLKIQLTLLLGISILLNLGFESAREWRRIAEQGSLQTHVFGWDGLAWYTWLLAAPVMLSLIQRYPLERGAVWKNLRPILIGCLLAYLVVANLRYLLRLLPNLWLPDERDLPTGWGNYLYNTFRVWPMDFLTFSGFFAVTFSLNYYFKYQRHVEDAVKLELRAAQLQSNLARAELAALRGQLHPHFIFNSFNALATLVRQRKNDAAVEIIAQLSALLRMAIDRSGLQEIPLYQEIEFIRRYLDIERVRFGEKLLVDFNLEPAALDALVPNIVLQPLVENAIKHGISLRTTPGTVRLCATREGNRLLIEIADDGLDEPVIAVAPKVKKGGLGLASARAQLDTLYGSDYRLEFLQLAGQGTKVRLDLPFRLPSAA